MGLSESKKPINCFSYAIYAAAIEQSPNKFSSHWKWDRIISRRTFGIKYTDENNDHWLLLSYSRNNSLHYFFKSWFCFFERCKQHDRSRHGEIAHTMPLQHCFTTSQNVISQSYSSRESDKSVYFNLIIIINQMFTSLRSRRWRCGRRRSRRPPSRDPWRSSEPAEYCLVSCWRVTSGNRDKTRGLKYID